MVNIRNLSFTRLAFAREISSFAAGFTFGLERLYDAVLLSLQSVLLPSSRPVLSLCFCFCFSATICLRFHHASSMVFHPIPLPHFVRCLPCNTLIGVGPGLAVCFAEHAVSPARDSGGSSIPRFPAGRPRVHAERDGRDHGAHVHGGGSYHRCGRRSAGVLRNACQPN